MVFNICGNRYRLAVKINYPAGIVLYVSLEACAMTTLLTRRRCNDDPAYSNEQGRCRQPCAASKR